MSGFTKNLKAVLEGCKAWQIQQAAGIKAFLTRLAMVEKVSAYDVYTETKD